jgi:KRAB domain-containing zinc finger protein
MFSGEFDFICKYCGKGFMQRKIYNQHLKKSHQVTQEEIDQFNWSANGQEAGENRCKDCGQEFNVPYTLFKHRALVHGHGTKFICDICGKAFISKPFLVSHQKYHKGIRSKKCTKCPSMFTEDRGLRTHLKRVHKMTDEEMDELM